MHRDRRLPAVAAAAPVRVNPSFDYEFRRLEYRTLESRITEAHRAPLTPTRSSLGFTRNP